MKLKKTIAGMLLVLIFMAQTVYARSANEGNYYKQLNALAQKIYNSMQEIIETEEEEPVRGFGVNITSTNPEVNLQELKVGEEFEVSVGINSFNNIGAGLVSLMGQLEYDANILDRISITGQNGWFFDDNSVHKESLKFITDNGKRITEPGEIVRITFKVKDTITEDTDTTIKIKGISASGGYGIIRANDEQVAIKIRKIEEEKPETITSEKYSINNEDKDISRIVPGTTVAEFKSKIETQNVTTNPTMIITDAVGNVLEDTSEVRTGMIVKVGKTLEYTLIVIGDVDGDLEDDAIGINDLAKLKLHLIDYEYLTGIALKAADIDCTGELDINDVAQIKLVLIGLMEIK